MPADSTLFDTLTAVQQHVLLALVAGQRISAAAKEAGIHRSTVHLRTQKHPDFARILLAARHHRANGLLDELGDLADLAIDTFRQLLSDEQAPASVRLKAAMEIVKLVESQRPYPYGSSLKHKRCCGNPVTARRPEKTKYEKRTRRSHSKHTRTALECLNFPASPWQRPVSLTACEPLPAADPRESASPSGNAPAGGGPRRVFGLAPGRFRRAR